jgi:hypothetical protein
MIESSDENIGQQNMTILFNYFLENISYLSDNDGTIYDSLKYTLLFGASIIELNEFIADSTNRINIRDYTAKDYISTLFFNSDKISLYGLNVSRNELNSDFLMLILCNILSNVHYSHIVCDHEFIEGLKFCDKCKAIKLILYKLGIMPDFINKFNSLAVNFHIRYSNFNTVIPTLVRLFQNNQANFFQAFLSALCKYGALSK